MPISTFQQPEGQAGSVCSMCLQEAASSAEMDELSMFTSKAVQVWELPAVFELANSWA